MAFKSQAELFKCPNCGSQYKLVAKIEADRILLMQRIYPERSKSGVRHG